MLEIYGKARCPYAWRVRLAAEEKGVRYEWLPGDVPDPDPRVAKNNPDGRSPLAVHDGFALTESAVIAQYVDEAFPGRALQPTDPKARARMRLAASKLGGFNKAGGRPDDPEAREAVDRAFAALDAELADGRAWLGGDAPSLADVYALPLVAAAVEHGFILAPTLAKASAYWERAQQHPSFRATKPPAPGAVPATRAHRESLVDESVAETFPGSDAPAHRSTT